MISRMTMLATEATAPVKGPVRIAIEDAVIIFVFSFVSILIADGSTTPTLANLYAPGLTALLAAVVAYAHARGILLRGG